MSARQTPFAALHERSLAAAAHRPDHEPLCLPAEAVRVHRNGIEFHYSRPLAPWTEVLVRVCRAGGEEPLRCTGVVVSCAGSARTGYHISMVLFGLAPHSAQTLAALAHSQLS